jgi:hypothetical protein
MSSSKIYALTATLLLRVGAETDGRILWYLYGGPDIDDGWDSTWAL